MLCKNTKSRRAHTLLKNLEMPIRTNVEAGNNNWSVTCRVQTEIIIIFLSQIVIINPKRGLFHQTNKQKVKITWKHFKDAMRMKFVERETETYTHGGRRGCDDSNFGAVTASGVPWGRLGFCILHQMKDFSSYGMTDWEKSGVVWAPPFILFFITWFWHQK